MNAASVVRVAPLLEEGYQDFTAFYGGGEIIRAGQTARLYDVRAQYELQREFSPRVAEGRAALAYNHPPFEALLFVPLTYLSYVPAYVVWSLLNVAMLAWSLGTLRGGFADVGQLGLAFLVVAAAGFVPIVNTLVQGQDSVLLLLLVAWSFAFLEEGRDVAAGVALGMGLFKFHFVIPLMIMLAVRRPRLLQGFFPVVAVLSLVSVGMVGWGGLADYARLLLHMEKNGAGGTVIAGMPNLRGVIVGLAGGGNGNGVTMAVTIACSVVVLAGGVWLAARQETSIRFVFAVASVVSIMVSYHALTHDLAWVLPVVLLLFAERGAGTPEEMQVNVMLLMVVYTIFVAGTVWPGVNGWWFVPVGMWIWRRYGALGETRRVPVRN